MKIEIEIEMKMKVCDKTRLKANYFLNIITT